MRTQIGGPLRKPPTSLAFSLLDRTDFQRGLRGPKIVPVAVRHERDVPPQASDA